MNVQKLNEFVRESGKTKGKIASESGISRMTLDNALQGGDIRISILESIARSVGVRVGDLFDECAASVSQRGSQNNINGDNIGQSPDQMASLYKQIEEKDRQIERLLNIIENRK